jgi:hypothetical protein
MKYLLNATLEFSGILDGRFGGTVHLAQEWNSKLYACAYVLKG